MQAYGTTGHQIAFYVGQHAILHFAYCRYSSPSGPSTYHYGLYDLTAGSFGSCTDITAENEYGYYVEVSTTGDNRAVIGGVIGLGEDGWDDPTFYWDFAEAASFFGSRSEVPPTISAWGSGTVRQHMGWSRFAYAEGSSDTVLHSFSKVWIEAPGARPKSAYYYFRRVGSDLNPDAAWDDPPRIIDTAFQVAHSIDASDDGEVVLAWIARSPCSVLDDDTLSGNDCPGDSESSPLREVYFQKSNDYGVTWQARVNVTKSYLVTDTMDTWRPWYDVTAFLDSDGNAHIVWTGLLMPAGTTSLLRRGRILHWSENVPYVRPVHIADWDPVNCANASGLSHGNVSRPTIGECNGRLYVLFVQYNDVPNGVTDDCADEETPGHPYSTANGELYMCISNDNGLTWDPARNLTTSRTPGCDSIGGAAGPCDSDDWPSITRFGTNVALIPGDTVTDIIVPSPGTDLGYYLDILYVNDRSPGLAAVDQGYWQLNDMRWFRLACVEPVLAPAIALTPDSILFPVYAKPCEEFLVDVAVENNGNADLSYTITPEEDSGEFSGWLTFSGFTEVVPPGLNNSVSGTVIINTGGIVCPDPAFPVRLTGRLRFESNAGTSPDYLEVDVIVVDSMYLPHSDTVSTTCLSLLVMNDGSFGDQGGVNGTAHMDYHNAGDCDTMATVYLFEGSPVVGWIDSSSGDTIINWSAYAASFLDSVGLVQASTGVKQDEGTFQTYMSEYTTNDPALRIQHRWFAPNQPDSCHFLIQELRLWSADQTDRSNLCLGELVDWDIPSDHKADNTSGFSSASNTLWQSGAELNLDDGTECQDNNRRFGGMTSLARYLKGPGYTPLETSSGRHFTGAFTGDNATHVYPYALGYDDTDLFTRLQDTGITLYSSGNPDSAMVDLHSIMTFVNNFSLDVGDTLVVYLALVTVQEGTEDDLSQYVTTARRWFCDHLAPVECSCCNLRGDADDGESINVADLTYLVNYLFKGGPAPACEEHGDADNSGTTNVADLTYLVNYLFKAGPEPPPCSDGLLGKELPGDKPPLSASQ